MKIKDHLRNIKESIEVIEESIQKGIKERQRNIGFNASVAAVEMLEVLLHKNNLIDPGAMIKHEWFSSIRRINERLPFDFLEKEKIIKLIMNIEEKRNLLCYGKPQPEETIKSVLYSFNQFREIIKKLGVDIK